MRRAVLALAASCAAAVPAGAVPRDGRVDQAIADTLGAHFNSRQINLNQPEVAVTLAAVNQASQACLAGQGTAPAGGHTWRAIMACLNTRMPQPFDVGRAGSGWAIWLMNDPPTDPECINITSSGRALYVCPVKTGFVGGGGDFGGGGNTNSFERDCGNIDYRLDPAGNLIVPSWPIATGGPMTTDGMTIYQAAFGNTGDDGFYNADSRDAAARWWFHRYNNVQNPDKRKWVGPYKRIGSTYYASSVAYRNNAGGIVNRVVTNIGAFGSGPLRIGWNYSAFGGQKTWTQRPCPDGASGGNAHFYAGGSSAGQFWNCIWYLPNYDLSNSGYAISDLATLDATEALNWPRDLHQMIKDCPVDPELIRKMADGLLKLASEDPSYTGIPYQPVQPSESRPGDTKVDDLGDTPGTVPSPGPGVSDPPPATPTTPGGTSGYKDECDFGTTGCTDPGTPQPTLDEPATGIMDPIFEWLPDLPSITFDTNASECPVWAVNLTEFGGPQWQFLIEKHCPLLEDNRAAIGALMLALFGVAAALIILRA